MKITTKLALLVISSGALMLSSCDSGSTSANSNGLSCDSIAGLPDIYVTHKNTGQTVFYSGAAIRSDCTIRFQNEHGYAEGSLTSREGNQYHGYAIDDDGIKGRYTLIGLDSKRYLMTNIMLDV